MLEEGLGDVSDGCGGDEGSVCKVLERILLVTKKSGNRMMKSHTQSTIPHHPDDSSGDPSPSDGLKETSAAGVLYDEEPTKV